MQHDFTVRASAPGSLMLLGEYAVLSGKPALVCAVDKRMSVILTPRRDHNIEIYSEALGEYKTNIDALQMVPPFRFILSSLLQYQAQLKHGYDIKITSEFSTTLGLGSSAAVTVAMLAALTTSLALDVSQDALIRQGVEVIRKVQGVGSGADIAASVCGGMVAYQNQPVSAEKLTEMHALTVWYSGFKTPTVNAIHKVHEKFAKLPELYQHLLNSIGECAQKGIELVRQKNWDQLGEIMNIQQGLMDALGVNTILLQEMIEHLRKDKGILGAKISGSGLGDCVIALGDYGETSSHNIPIKITPQGVYCEKV